MKKVLFTILGFGIGFLTLSAQEVKEPINYDFPQFKIVVPSKTSNNNAKRDLGQGWFDYPTAYSDFNGITFKSAVMFLQPDSNLVTVYSDGNTVNAYMHVLGRVNDPRDEVFSNNPVRFSRHNTYTWDSIRFTQFYPRFVDSMFNGVEMVSIVDTLFIQYFRPAGLNFSSYTYNADPTTPYYYTAPNRDNFNKNTKLNSSAFKTDTVLLTKEWADSVNLDGANTTFFSRTLVAPVGVTIAHSATDINANIVGHAFTFRPMKKPSLGDTGIAMNGSTVYNKFNMYGMRYFYADNLKIETKTREGQNNTFVTNKELAYGQSSNGWKSYFPGSIFTNTIVEGTDYYLTSQTVSIDNVDANGNGIGNIYPNPSNGQNEIMVPVVLSSAQTVTLTICDITGKVIKTISGTYEAGDFDIAVSTEGMSNGVYTCTMSCGAYTSASKFILN